jgi:hypothetical protein
MSNIVTAYKIHIIYFLESSAGKLFFTVDATDNELCPSSSIPHDVSSSFSSSMTGGSSVMCNSSGDSPILRPSLVSCSKDLKNYIGNLSSPKSALKLR